MAKKRITIAKPDIEKLFEESPQKIFDLSDLRKLYSANHKFWRLATSMTCNEFIKYIIKNSKLRKEKFDFQYRPIIKYTWGIIPFYELLLSLKPNCYLTHFTAMYFHELTEQIPKKIYVNFEQKPKPKNKINLEQERIDYAFKNKTRLCNNITKYRDLTICLLNGMHTHNAGVFDARGYEGESIRLTDVERTLIDITVRPEYAGGPYEVLRAYRLAKNKVSINRLTALLKNINYTYPYHQAVGFYLDVSNEYEKSHVDLLLNKFPLNNDFYLLHKIEDMDYSKKWRLFFPKGFC